MNVIPFACFFLFVMIIIIIIINIIIACRTSFFNISIVLCTRIEESKKKFNIP